jgi:hypothetical protein
VYLSTITRMESTTWLFSFPRGRSIMKSSVISSYGRLGILNACASP